MASMAEAAEEGDRQQDANDQACEESHKCTCRGELRAVRV